MNIKILIYFSSITFFLCSCATLNSDKIIENQVELTDENLHLLNGEYLRTSMINSDKIPGDLFWNFYTKGYDIDDDSLYFVKLKVIDKKNLNVTLFKNDSIIKSKTLTGKIKNGYYEFKRRIFIIPALYLNIVRTTKFRIGLLDNNNLTTDYKQIAWGTGFVIIPFYDKEREMNFEYKKIMNSRIK